MKFLLFSKSIHGTLHSVDQYLNIKLMDVSVTDPEKFPHMVRFKNLTVFFFLILFIFYKILSNLLEIALFVAAL
jgi:hypothetical protein